MKLLFTKGAGKYDFMAVLRDGVASGRIDCPKQRIIPHDMVHYAVEHTLRAHGFLGRVKAGEVAGFGMKPQVESDSVERLVEVFQGDEWSGASTSPQDMLAMYRVTCEARQCPTLPLDDAGIVAVRDCIADLSARWAQVKVGDSLELVI
jgi:hypothetical protein